MSTTIDSKVVEMRFDNQHFEQNARTSISTLDKLKQSLNLTGTSKGLENLNSAASKVNLSGLSSGIETVSAKFSAMQVVGITALANLTNSAVNAGKRMVSALTIQPITTGFNEYELKMGSIQTIMASTGKSLEVVNGYLNELNEYSDKTIYSFSDMTQNIGKFTNAGVGLEDAVMAIKGISNEAAVSGANANEASRAMYNFAQALSAGYVKLIDWKSIENANMATVEFKQQLIDTAVEMGTLSKAADGMYATLDGTAMSATKNFNDALQDQWMTSDVLITTLKKYADETTDIGSKATQAATEVKTFTQMMDSLKESAQSGWAQTWEIVFGDFYEGKELWTGIYEVVGGLIDKVSDLRNNFLKGALGSKWEKLANTIEKAGFSTEDFKERLTETLKENGINVKELTDKYKSLDKAIEAGAVPAKILSKALNKLLGTEKDLDKTTGKITESTEELSKVADRVINGEFGDGEKRIKALTEAGYDYAKVQNIVNEKLGESYRHVSTLTEAEKANADELSKLSDETLKNKGYTEEQIEALRELRKAADEGGTSISELLDDMERPSGRTLIIESFKNVLEALKEPLNAVKEAWQEIFGDNDSSATLYDVIENIHDFTETLDMSEDSVKKFKTICEGLFAGLEIGNMLFSMSLLSGLKILNAVLDLFGITILDVGDRIAQVIIKVHDWIEENTIFIGYAGKIAEVIKAIIDGVIKCAKAFGSLDIVTKAIEKVKEAFKKLFGGLTDGINNLSFDSFIKMINNAFTELEAWIKSLDGSDMAKNIVDGLANGLIAGVDVVVSAIITLGQRLIEAFAGVIDSHSPSKVFFALGTFIVLGLIGGILNTEGNAISTIVEMGSGLITGFIDAIAKGYTNIKDVCSKFGNSVVEGLKEDDITNNLLTFFKNGFGTITEFLANLDWGGILALAAGGGMLFTINNIANAIDNLAGAFKNITGIGKSVSKVLDSFSKFIDAKAFRIKAGAILDIAKAIGILAVSLFLLASLKSEQLQQGAKAMIGIAVAVGILAIACNKMNGIANIDSGVSLAALGWMLISLAASMLIVAIAIEKLSMLPNEANIDLAVDSLIYMLAGISLVLVAFGKFVKGATAMNISQAGGMILKMSVALLLMVGVIKLISKLKDDEVIRGIAVIAAFELLFAGIVAISSLGGPNAAKAGTMILQMAGAILLLTFAMQLMKNLSTRDVIKAIGAVSAMIVLFGLVTMMSYVSGEHAAKAGAMMLGMGVAILAAAAAMKIIASIDGEGIKKGLAVITALGVFFGALVAVSYFAGEHAIKAGVMLLLMSAALMIVVGILYMLKEMDTDGLGRALGVLTVLEALFAGLIFVSGYAKNCEKTIFNMAIVIGVLATAVAALTYVAKNNPEELDKATQVISALIGAFAVLLFATRYADTTPQLIKTLWSLAGVAAVLGLVIGLLSKFGGENQIQSAASLGILLFALVGVMKILEKVKPKKMGKQLVAEFQGLLMVLAALGLVVGLLSKFGGEGQIQSAVALSALLFALVGVMKILGFVKPVSPAAVSSLGQLTIVVGVLAGILGLMTKLDAQASIGSAIALGILINALAASLLVLGLIKTIPAGAITSLYALSGVVAILGIILGVMSSLDAGKALGHVAALSLFVYALTGVIAILSLIGVKAGAALVGVLALAALAVPLYLFVDILSKMQGIENAMSNVLALSVLTGVLTLLLIPLTIVGSFGLAALAGVGLLTLMAVPLNLFVSVLAKMQDIQNALTNAQILMDLMTRMTLLLIPLTLVGAVGLAAIAGIGVLIAFITAVGAFVAALGFINDKVPELETFLDKGVTVLGLIGTAIGTFVGNIVSSFSDSLADSLPKLGSTLSAFIKNTMPFINGVKMVDERAITGIKALVGAILALTAADFIAGISNLMPFTSGMANLGKQLSDFAINALPFIIATGAIKPESVQGVKTLMEAILMLTAADFLSGITNFITGGSSLADFGKQLIPFGEAIVKYAETVGGLNEGSIRAMTESAKAGKVLAEMADIMPNSGGWMGTIFGENDIDTFGNQLAKFGKALVSYANSVVDLKVGAIENSIGPAKSLVELAESLPNSGGWISTFAGENDWSTFSFGLGAFGASLKSYSDAVDGVNAETIKNSVDAAAYLVDLADTLPNSGGAAGLFAGENDWDTFGSGLTDFGKTLKEYSDAVLGLSVSAVSNSVTAANKLVEMINNTNNINTSGIEGFKYAVETLGQTNVNSFVNAFSGASSKMSSVGSSMTDSIVKGLNSKKGSLSVAANGLISSLSKSLSGNNDQFNKIGSTLITHLVNGIRSQTSKAENTVRTLAGNAASAAREKYFSFYSAGSYLVTGFANGISANTFKAVAKARDMAKATVEAAKGELDVNSPSKVFRAIGYSVPEGFAMGIDRLSNLVSRSSTNMADGAVSTVSKSISRIADAVNADIDTQPTIRPVVDMSDVESKANSINGMFGLSPSMGLMANVGSISSMMSQNGQNGNGDVVSAINKLRKDLGNIGGNTYNVNGVTYDDGSNVSNTVEALIRAVKIERRV